MIQVAGVKEEVLPELITSLPNTNIADAVGQMPSVSLERLSSYRSPGSLYMMYIEARYSSTASTSAFQTRAMNARSS